MLDWLLCKQYTWRCHGDGAGSRLAQLVIALSCYYLTPTEPLIR